MISYSISEKRDSRFEKEGALMKNLRPHHPHVVAFLGITCPSPLCIVTEV